MKILRFSVCKELLWSRRIYGFILFLLPRGMSEVVLLSRKFQVEIPFGYRPSLKSGRFVVIYILENSKKGLSLV